ncbi:unnamed protein product [Caenorhabditis sp. 36 PRJEB53466]|nr:unnamed protein product [Caenorhabditis sp. 36 PRJEB53466]
MAEHWSDTVVQLWNTGVGLIGFGGNALLIALIVTSTPKPLVTYSVMLFIGAVSNCFIGLSSLFATSRVFTAKNEMFFMFSGLCTHFSDSLEFNSQFCLLWYNLQEKLFLLHQFMLIAACLFRILLLVFLFTDLNKALVCIFCCLYSWLHITLTVISIKCWVFQEPACVWTFRSDHLN